MKSYDTAVYAATRLVGTVVRKGDLPIVVGDVIEDGGTIKVVYGDLDGPPNTHSCNLDEVNLDPIPLGYANTRGGAIYMTRMPMRKDWKQGLRINNMMSADNYPIGGFKGLKDAILGKFPSLSTAATAVNGGSKDSVAFSRNFAVHKGGNVVFKGRLVVGKVTPDRENVTLEDKYSWVKEILNEDLGVA